MREVTFSGNTNRLRAYKGNAQVADRRTLLWQKKSLQTLIAKSTSANKETNASNVIDFMPFLAIRQRHAAREATFLTLFLIFTSLFIVLV